MSVRNCGELGINLQKIVKRLLANQNLCKLLYYSSQDPLHEPDIEDTSILLNKLINIIPQYNPAETDQSVITIVVQNGVRNSSNDEFRDMLIRFYTYVPIKNWIIKDSNLRPFLILGEIENSLQGKTVNGLGALQSGDFSLNIVTEQMTSYYIDFYITNFN